MKALVVFFSRTGITAKVAKEIAVGLGADIEEIQESSSRRGFFGFLRSGFEAATRRVPKIKPIQNEPSGYDLVVVGTPVWAGNMASPLRAYLSTKGKEIKRIAYFCTMGGDGDKRVFKEIEQLSKPPVATLTLVASQVKKGNFNESVKDFLKKCCDRISGVDR